jgi:teichuronic acid biosynthesis glycosyltransferase TuaG
MPKISIIIPCYNSEQFIDRTIKSVLCQTFSDWELLLIDDHSTDKTKDILEKYAKNDTRIKILQTKENSGGPALPKNIGIENAKGEYIAFLDHDDEWLPEKLEKQLAVFENSKDEKLGLVSCYC